MIAKYSDRPQAAAGGHWRRRQAGPTIRPKRSFTDLRLQARWLARSRKKIVSETVEPAIVHLIQLDSSNFLSGYKAIRDVGIFLFGKQRPSFNVRRPRKKRGDITKRVTT